MSSRVFKLYDTMTRQVKEMRPQEQGHFKMYSCGPTVYNFAHIGNFRTFLSADLVVRTAEALGWRVSYVSNITDVGHLTQDDIGEGEDRMEKGLNSKDGAQFANVWDLADYYAVAFKNDWRRLNLKDPMVWPRATQHMSEQIRAVEKLVESGHAYVTPTGVYFRLSSFPDHGKLSGNTQKDQLLEGVREEIVKDENKEHPFDFALWKKDDKHLMQWFSPWGWGFPGWHIECSVMAMQYLGETLDLHAGGEDLVFPHHESEIAQSECLTGHTFANHWMHTRFLQVNGQKMSKSLGNFYTVRDLIDDKGFDPLALRYALMSVPYGKPLNFTIENLVNSAAPAIERFRECERRAQAALASGDKGENETLSKELDLLYDQALDAMCDDLNTSIALAKAFEGTRVMLRESDSHGTGWANPALKFLDKINALLGIVRPEHELSIAVLGASQAVDESRIAALIEERAQAKSAKDFATADRIRAELEGMGLELRDTPTGTLWKLKSPSA